MTCRRRHHIGKIHLQRIRSPFAYFECRCRRRRRCNNVNFLKRCVKIRFDERPCFLCLPIICVLVASTQREGTDHNPALYLLTERFTPCPFIHINQILRTFVPVTVADPVVSCEIGTRLSGGDDVIRRNGIFGMWQRNFLNRGTDGFKHSDGSVHAIGNFCV